MIFILDNNRGSVMSIALLMLVLLTTIVIFMSRSSTTDVQISANERYSTTAFYVADAGAYGQAKVVGKVLEMGGMPSFGGPTDDLPNVDYIVADFYNQVMGFGTDSDDAMVIEDPAAADDVATGNEDIQFQLGVSPNTYEINVGVSNQGTTPLFGGGAEFGAGSMGIGSGSTGGVAITFAALSVGEGPKNSRSTVEVQYRKIPGTSGGL